MKSINSSGFKVMLSQLSHGQAQNFYRFHSNAKKAKQVYLNTLAVQAVNSYLNCLGIETDLMAGDSWNPVMQTLTDSADLVIKEKGKVECRPLLPNTKKCTVPAEVWQDRIAYIVVELNAKLTEATLVGCVKTVTTEALPIEQLEPLENLIGYLSQPQTNLINLRQWFEDIFELQWQALDNLIHPDLPKQSIVRGDNINSRQSLEIEERNYITGAKLIDLGVKLGQQTVFLVMTVIPEEEDKLGVQVQVYPLAENSYLPPHLELSLLSEQGDILAKVPSRLSDNFIQLPYFKGKRGETFNIQVTLDHLSLIEKFTF